ncbi:7TM diverse intracellular signaling domain-containing protein [Cohnella sp. GCM10027633]|uniref:sensor histidine kinase n=1 Tax=unclassified Cohnella TaxID=2636738 RepID=UPI00364213B2
MRKTLAEHNRLFYLMVGLFVAGVALVWILFMPKEGAPATAVEPGAAVRLTEGLDKLSLNDGMQVLPDPGGALSFEQAQASPAKERFVPADGVTAFGLDGDTYWIRATIANETAEERWVLRLSNAVVDTVAAYADGQRLQGKEIAGVGKQLDDHYWAYELVLPADRAVTVHLRATTGGSMILPLELMRSSAYHFHLRAEYLLFGLYYGFVLLMAAYFVSMYVFLRNTANLYYSIYIAFFAVSQLFWNGLPQELLGENNAVIRLLLRTFDSYEGIFLFFFIMCLWFVLFFLDKMLQLRIYAPRLRYATTAVKWASPLVVSGLLFHWPGFTTIAIWYEFGVMLVLVTSILVSVFRGNIAARYIVLGMIAILGIAVPSILYTFSLAEYNVLTHYGYQLGSVAEFVVFAFALSYQTRQLELDKDNARQLVIAKQEELVRTLERWNEELEHTVRERTESLVQAQRRRNELLQNISHDVRSPLTVVQGGIRAMMLGIQVQPGEQEKHLENLYGKVRYVTRFIDDLFKLSLAEQEAAASYDEAEELRMKPWVEQEFVFLEEFVRIAGLRCESTIRADGDPVMTIDPHGMRRALSNLVHNACKFSPADKLIRLEASIDPDGVRIAVEDEGQGIGEDDLNRIFERNNRGSQADPSTGSGLGLAIAKEIVEAHGGTISAESVLGRGSRFVVHIPANRGYD